MVGGRVQWNKVVERENRCQKHQENVWNPCCRSSIPLVIFKEYSCSFLLGNSELFIVLCLPSFKTKASCMQCSTVKLLLFDDYYFSTCLFTPVKCDLKSRTIITASGQGNKDLELNSITATFFPVAVYFYQVFLPP